MSNPVLHDASTVYCNTWLGLQKAYGDGLPSSAQVFTYAPEVAIHGGDAVRRLERDGFDSRRAAFSESLLAFCTDVYDCLKAHPDGRKFAVTAARQAIQVHRQVFKILDLTEKEFLSPSVFIELQTGNPSVDELLRSRLPGFIAKHEPHTVYYHADIAKTLDASRPSLMDWLRMTNRHELQYRLLRRFWRDKQPSSDKPRAVIISANELITETACHLSDLGYAILHRKAVTVPMGDEADVEAEMETVSSLLGDIPERYFSNWVAPSAVARCVDVFNRELRQAIAQQVKSVGLWKDALETVTPKGRSVVLVNCPISPVMIGLADYCNARHIPLVGFQHGVTREICASHNQYAANFENGVTDLFLTFNESAKRVSDASVFAKGRTECVGIPTHYHALKRKRKLSTQPLLYISTNLYSGNVNLMNGHLSDVGRCTREMEMIEQCLGKLPYRVLFKTYPSGNRYADLDPVLGALSACDNVDVYDQPINLKNLVGKHRVLMTSRATSTLSVCLLSGRPLVFVDMPDHAPLYPELKKEFAEALFFFDYQDEDVLEQITTFLSQPIKEIERQWEEKAPMREALIERYCSGPGRGAGKRSATLIHKLVEQSV
jgi:hypothetical protein